MVKRAGKRDGDRPPRGESEEAEFKVDDRRHWTRVDDVPTEMAAVEAAAAEPEPPSVVGELERRAQDAEQRLQEYIEAFQSFKRDQEAFRERMRRDIDRRVELKFGELVEGFLESVDHLDLALEHVAGVAEAEPLAAGVAMARDRFLATLAEAGVEKLVLDGEEFDPNHAEAVRVDPVDSADEDGRVTETLRPGYVLGERVIRAARVAVGRHAPRAER